MLGFCTENRKENSLIQGFCEETACMSGYVYYTSLMPRRIQVPFEKGLGIRPNGVKWLVSGWGRGWPESIPASICAIDLSWSGPGQDEVIVVEGKKVIQVCNLCQVGLICLLSLPCLPPALPCSQGDWPLKAAFPRLLCFLASIWVQSTVGTDKILAGEQGEVRVFLFLILCFKLNVWQQLGLLHDSSSHKTDPPWFIPLWSPVPLKMSPLSLQTGGW